MEEVFSQAMDSIYEVLGQAVTYVSGNVSKKIEGIFEDLPVEAYHGDVTVSSSEPKLTLKASELGGLPHITDRFIILEKTYTVKKSFFDGYGNIVVELYLES